MASTPDAPPALAAEAETEDLFLGGRLRLRQPRGGYRAGTDAILLAACVPARRGESALDLGCGAGAAILALGTRVAGLRLAGLEVQGSYAALARANAARNGLALAVLEASVESPPRGLGAFDHVIMNPPYFDRDASRRAVDPGRDLSHGGPAPLAAWLGLAGRRLSPGGWLTMVHRVAALPAALAGLPAGLGAVEVLPLVARPGAEAATMILRARKGGRSPFRLWPALALHGDSSGYAPTVEAALRDGAALAFGTAR